MLEFTPAGAPTGRLHGGHSGSGIGQLGWAFGIGAAGNDVVVADTGNRRVQRWNPAAGGTSQVVWTANGLKSPTGVAVSGNIVYVADSANSRIV